MTEDFEHKGHQLWYFAFTDEEWWQKVSNGNEIAVPDKLIEWMPPSALQPPDWHQHCPRQLDVKSSSYLFTPLQEYTWKNDLCWTFNVPLCVSWCESCGQLRWSPWLGVGPGYPVWRLSHAGKSLCVNVPEDGDMGQDSPHHYQQWHEDWRTPSRKSDHLRILGHQCQANPPRARRVGDDGQMGTDVRRHLPNPSVGCRRQEATTGMKPTELEFWMWIWWQGFRQITAVRSHLWPFLSTTLECKVCRLNLRHERCNACGNRFDFDKIFCKGGKLSLEMHPRAQHASFCGSTM